MTKAWDDVSQRLCGTLHLKLKAICTVANRDGWSLFDSSFPNWRCGDGT